MRYAIVSDIHANLAALQAVLGEAGSADEVWCLGDIVGYGPEPNECVETVKQRASVCIPGNHDWACIGKIDIADFNGDAAAAIMWAQRRLSAPNLAYLDSLPETVTTGDFTLAHGSPREPIWEYIIYPGTAKANFAHFSTQVCLVGHTHLPAMFQETKGAQKPNASCQVVPIELGNWQPIGRRRRIINPGSVGQPRDGNPWASYLLLDTSRMMLEYRRVPYPVEITQRNMQKAGLPPRLYLRLGYGR